MLWAASALLTYLVGRGGASGGWVGAAAFSAGLLEGEKNQPCFERKCTLPDFQPEVRVCTQNGALFHDLNVYTTQSSVILYELF